MLLLAAGWMVAMPVLAQTKLPDDLIDALNQGYEIKAVVGQGPSNQDHVVYLRKDRTTLICGFRFVLTDQGFDKARSTTLGVCTGFVGAN